MSKFPMGIGLLGDSSILFSRRKFRRTFSAQFGDLKIDETFVKLNAHPLLDTEKKESEISYLPAKTWVPGSSSGPGGTITTTHFGMAHACPQAEQIYAVLREVYNFTDEQKQADPDGYKGVGELKLYDGCGGLLETWTLNGLRPTEINFGYLDYSSVEECDVEIAWKYDSVVYTPVPYTSFPPYPIPNPISPVVRPSVESSDSQVKPLLGGETK